MPDNRQGVLPAADVRHGTYNAYTNLGCRCERCRKANATRQADVRDRLAVTRVPEHGTNNAYNNYGCRCQRCRADHAAVKRDYNRRRRSGAA